MPLSQGDLDGLRFLYPLCDDLAPTVVSCFKGRRLSGWLRLALVTSAPFLLSVFAILLPLTCLRWRDRRRIKRLGKELGDAEAQVRAYKNELKKALRGAVADAVERPATALRDAVRGSGPAGAGGAGWGRGPRGTRDEAGVAKRRGQAWGCETGSRKAGGRKAERSQPRYADSATSPSSQGLAEDAIVQRLRRPYLAWRAEAKVTPAIDRGATRHLRRAIADRYSGRALYCCSIK